MDYLIAFEEGLRKYSADIYALGTNPLRSRKYWAQVPLWRKREAYIALARSLLGRSPDYKQWDCFRFADYQDRQALAKTYVIRHHPLSDGNDEDNFKGEFCFDWDQHHYSPNVRRPSASTAVKVEPKMRKRDGAAKDNITMIYDVEKGCLVPFE